MNSGHINTFPALPASCSLTRICLSSNITSKRTRTKQDGHQCLLDWNEVDNLCRERASVSECMHGINAAFVQSQSHGGSWLAKPWLTSRREKDKSPSDWQQQHRVGVKCRCAEAMQSGVCRSGIKWVKHGATPGPCLKRRLDKSSPIQNSPCVYLWFRVFACLCGVCCVIISMYEMWWEKNNTAKSFAVCWARRKIMMGNALR